MQSICAHFDVSDPAQLGWAHGVNSKVYLSDVCADPAVHMVEGDVHFAAEDALPCMAHAWQDIADLDVATWVELVMAAGKGIKLDFADAAAVEPTLAVLQRLKPTVPVMLHANVFTLLPAEGGKPSDGLEPEQFVRLCQQYCPQAVLSLGWSLKREADADGRMEEVLIHQMADMSLKRLGPVNYGIEIRAGYTSGWERGAALIFDPLPSQPPAITSDGNVVQAGHLFRRVAA
ncbi:MAG: DUF2181 domain-containing protein [Alphaproteobacteria bacterium]